MKQSPYTQEKMLTNDEKVKFIAQKMYEIIEILGLDLSDPSLANTPTRIAKMYVNEFFSGLDDNTFPELSFVKNQFDREDQQQMIFMKTELVSFCEHHFIPMFGSCYIAYLPTDQCIGLSKLPRIVRFFARRPQLQERLTTQIADCLIEILNTPDVAVSITAQHLCVMTRGIEDHQSSTTTNSLRGAFLNEERRKEFFETISRS